MAETVQLSELQSDAITELLNIGMGRAAASLSEMVNEEIKLSVPSLELLSRQRAALKIGIESHRLIAGVKQHFDGPFGGDALLLFPQEKSLELVRVLMRDEIPLEMLTELEQDTLTEVGNIILNSCISTLANALLLHEITSGLPNFINGTANEILDVTAAHEDEIVMFLRMDFAIKSQDISGYVAFVLDIPAIERFKVTIDSYLGQL